MANEIVNTLRSKSTIFITGNTASVISLANLAASATETVTGSAVTHVMSSTDGKWQIWRGPDNTVANSVMVLELFGQNYMPLNMHDIAVANTSSRGYYITNSGTGGTLIMQVSKTATYNPSLD